MHLTFRENHFVVQDPRAHFLGSDWKPVARHVFKTTNIKEAVRFRKYADAKAEMIFTKLMLKAMPLPAGGLFSPMPLLPFQEEKGVPFILTRNRSYLAHQPGLGKSAQFVVAVNSKPGQALITCPAFLKINWAREITKWSYKDFPSIAIVPGSSQRHYMNWNADFIICPDSMFNALWVREGLAQRKFRHVAIDEAHRFKTAETSRTTTLFGGRNKKLKSPGLIYSAEHVVALSGTPMLNRPIELWPILYAMAPELIDFMPMQDFGFRYCGPWRDNQGRIHFTGSSNEKELAQRLKPLVQRIRKEDVLKDLPEKVREVIFIDKEVRDKELIQMDNALLKKLSKSSIEIPDSLGEFALVRHAVGQAKVKWAADFIESYLDDGESILVFAHHKDVIEKLYWALQKYKPMVINGSVSQPERTKYQDLFQSGKRPLLMGNIGAMNLGLTLTKATRVIFLEYDWTPANNEQAEDRAHRIGQHDSVFVQYLVLPNSLDERVLQRVLEKQERIGKVIG